MPEVAFVCSPRQSWIMQELGETIRYELELQGIPCSVHSDGFPEPLPHRLYALMAPREFVAREGPDALPDDAILKRTVFICADPPGEELDAETFALMRRAGVVFDVDVRSVLKLHREGIPARGLRPGHSVLRDRFDPAAERPIDVTFLGTASPRRLALLSRYASVLSRYECRFVLADPAELNSAESPSFLAESKYELLGRSKVVINLHRDEHSYLEWLRMIEAMHSGAVFVTEHASGLAPFVPGEHLLVAGADALPYVVESVLEDAEMAQRLRTQAHERLSSWLPFALPVGVLRAALVELVGNPVADGVGLGRPLSARPDDARASRRGGLALANPEARTLERELSATRAELVEVRRQVAELQQLVLDQAGAPRFHVAAETPAWSFERSAHLSLIVTPQGDRTTLRAALASCRNAVRHGVACEVIVVDAPAGQPGASDAVAGELFEEWMRANPDIPALSILAAVDSTVGSARSAALEHAGAPYCLIVGPDDRLSARCAEVLLGELEAAPADVSVVYPIVSAGGSLLNWRGWDSLRVRAGSDVHSPYMIRRDHLLAVGAFAEGPVSHGELDSAVWLALIEHGWHGRRVPQVLAGHAPGTPSATAAAPVSGASATGSGSSPAGAVDAAARSDAVSV
jgi:hypothetical protein